MISYIERIMKGSRNMKRTEILKEIIENHSLQDYEIEELNNIISSSIGININDEVYIVIDSEQEQPIIAIVVKIILTTVDYKEMHLIHATDIENVSKFFSREDIGRILFTNLTDAEEKLKEIKV
jgi:hypothetical protein